MSIITAKFSSVCPVCSVRVEAGSKVEWKKGEKARHVTCPPQEPGAAARAPVARAPRAPREYRAPVFVGEQGAYQAEFQGDKRDRTPQRDLGAASWLKDRGALIAVVLVGYHPATYVRADDAEDMGHYGVESGYYGTMHFRAATAAEYAALQVSSPRPLGTLVQS